MVARRLVTRRSASSKRSCTSANDLTGYIYWASFVCTFFNNDRGGIEET